MERKGKEKIIEGSVLNTESGSYVSNEEPSTSGTNTNWGDYNEDDYSNIEIVEDGCGEFEQERFSAGCCRSLDLKSKYLPENVISLMKSLDLSKSIGCFLNDLRNSLDAMLTIQDGTFGKELTLHLVDEFLRLRHDLLHNLSMLALSQTILETDQKFSDVFNEIRSNKTPDRIIKSGSNVAIVETTATLNVYKSYITKGKIEEGFSSKYSHEISNLTSLGYSVSYHVLSFDVKNHTNEKHLNDIRELAEVLGVEVKESEIRRLEHTRYLYCNYSTDIVKKYSKEVTALLSRQVVLTKIQQDLDFLYQRVDPDALMPAYDRLHVSMNVYNRVNSSWPRFEGMVVGLARKSKVDRLYKPYFDHANNRFTFKASVEGLSIDDLIEIIVTHDRVRFCKNLIQVYSNQKFDDRCDLEFFEKVSTIQDKQPDNVQCREQILHADTRQHTGRVETPAKYSGLVCSDSVDMENKYRDPDYEEKLLDGFSKFFRDINTEEDFSKFCLGLKKKPFANYTLSSDVLKHAVIGFKSNMLSKNTPSSNVMLYQKQPFLLPLMDVSTADYINYTEKPVKGLLVLALIDKSQYTQAIFDSINNVNFVWGSGADSITSELQSQLDELKSLNSSLLKLQFEYMAENKLSRLPKASKVQGAEEISKSIAQVNRKVAQIRGPGFRKSSMCRLPTKKRSVLRQAFDDEMEHFRKQRSKSIYKGVGLLEDLSLDVDFGALKTELLTPGKCICPDEIYHEYASPDATLLSQLKTDYLKLHSDRYRHLKSTNLYHSSAFISRLCHTLSYHSQSPMSGDYVAVDNLGYDNVILMVKGGKKIFKTKKSKLFRLLYPVHSSIMRWYSDPYMQSSISTVLYKKVNYILTPWKALDETVLNDGLTFLHRTMAYIMLSHEMNISLALDKCFFNVILSFHARRKSEELLHNLRYICVNSIADLSRVDLMLPELAGFNYDYFQCYIRRMLEKNFYTFSSILLKYNNEDKTKTDFKLYELKSMFDGSSIECLEDLTMVIYSTFLMSKAPTNQKLEQVANLKSMLSTKSMHDKESSSNPSEQYAINGIVFDGDILKYWDRLFTSDFNYDPTMCHNIGNFTASYLKNLVSEGDLNAKWVSIMNGCWDSFANTKGLRGEEKNFFNKKGYYIVYNEVLKIPNYLSSVLELLKGDEDEYNKRKKLNELNLTYQSEIENKPLKEVVFHVVDKKQRGGKREIFVMDLKTKIHQQAIEKFVQFICKKIPNEAISIPSNRRLQHIHTNVYERSTGQSGITYNLTLDCRKWAPHSMLGKFVDFIDGLSPILPQSFVTHFKNFFSLMYNKKIYTKQSIIDYFNSNEALKDNVDTFTYDGERGGFYFNQSFSWVMGIFNYMSSLLHVMNQIYASHIILKSSMIGCSKMSTLHMNAHSDDSGGKLVVESQLEMKKTFFIYELMLKSCNHMLSEKKCNVSKKYFEFLSVLYINNKLLSLLTKITGSFSFHPTDKGYASDVNECYTKSVDILSNGGTFDICYLAMKIGSHLIYKFYFNKNPTALDYRKPPHLLGVPDSHPLIVLISGSDSDIIRLVHTEGKDLFDKFVYMADYFASGANFDDDLIQPIKSQPKISTPKYIEEQRSLVDLDQYSEETQWMIKNMPIHNTAMNTLKYLSMLHDKNFVASMIDENITRRISRAFFYRTGRAINTPLGQTSYKTIKTAIDFFIFEHRPDVLKDEIILAMDDFKEAINRAGEKIQNSFKLYQLLNKEVFMFMEHLDGLSYTQNDVVISYKTCKPIHFNMQKTVLPTNSEFDPASLCLWMTCPKNRWVLEFGDDYKGRSEQINNFFELNEIKAEKLDRNWLFGFLRRLKGKYVKESFIYSNMPHNVRDITTFKDMLLFLSHNSFKNKQIKGITMPLSDSMSSPLDMVLSGAFNKELVRTLTFIDFCFCIINDKTFFNFMSRLELKGAVLGCKGDTLYGILNELLYKWSTNVECSNFVVPHIKSIIAHMDDELVTAPWLNDSYYYCFTKRQRLIGNTWLGKGVLFISTPELKLELHLSTNKIEKVIGNRRKINIDKYCLGYINSVLMSAGLPRLDDSMIKPDLTKWEKTSMGLNAAGQYCICQIRELKSCIKEFEYMPVIQNPASSIKISRVMLQKNFSYSLTVADELLGDKHYTINVFKTAAKDTYDLLSVMYDTEKNRKKIGEIGEEYQDYLKMFIGEAIGVDLNLPRDRMFEFYKITKLYEIIRTLYQKQRISPATFQPRKHLYPGQEGGLLSCLIAYKEQDSSFMFDSEMIMSSEMMSLKASQPEAFISNLTTNIKEKYEALYSEDDKNLIMMELSGIQMILDDDRYKGRLLSLLTTWGFVGVMGSLNELKYEKKVDNYLGIRANNDVGMRKFDIQILNSFWGAIVRSAEQCNYFAEPLGKGLLCRNLTELKMIMISYVHSYMISSYGLTSRNPCQILNLEILKIKNTLKRLFLSKEYEDLVVKYLKDEPLLNVIPFDHSNVSNMIVMLETIMLNLIYHNSSTGKLDFNKVRQHDHNLIQPYVKTRDILSNGPASFSLSSLNRHGVISRGAFDRINSHKIMEIDGILYDYNCGRGVESKVAIPFNKHYFVERPVLDDDEDELFDVVCELYTDEPDSDTVDEYMKNHYAPDYKRTSSVRFKGKVRQANHIEAKYFILPELKSGTKILSKIRNSATTIVIISNCFIQDLIECEDDRVMVFNKKTESWHNNTLLDPECLLYYVLDSRPINTKAWCRFLNVDLISKKDIFEDSTDYKSYTHINKFGDEITVMKYQTQHEKLELLRMNLISDTTEFDDLEEMEEGSGSEKKAEKVESIYNEMLKEGIDKEFCESMRTQFYKGGESQDFYKEMMEKYLDERKLKNIINEKTKKAINEVIGSIDDSNKAIKIFEVASVFSVGDPSPSEPKNKSLRDKRVRAEVNCLGNRLIDLLLSGRLCISKEYREVFNKLCSGLKFYTSHTKKNRGNKNFLLDCACLIVNDAYDDSSNNKDEIFIEIANFLTLKIVDDEMEVDSHDETYGTESSQGRIKYDWL